jgi:hypothetical protein
MSSEEYRVLRVSHMAPPLPKGALTLGDTCTFFKVDHNLHYLHTLGVHYTSMSYDYEHVATRQQIVGAVKRCINL